MPFEPTSPSSQPDVYLTAYALWGLKLASDAGYAVDPAALQSAIAYARRGLASEPASGGRHSAFTDATPGTSRSSSINNRRASSARSAAS